MEEDYGVGRFSRRGSITDGSGCTVREGSGSIGHDRARCQTPRWVFKSAPARLALRLAIPRYETIGVNYLKGKYILIIEGGRLDDIYLS